ncbi:translin-associated factor X-interacting protein 1 isoform X2 [Pungitius pungitius]|uniref:translin-associated factor X-interacting protein 1 isoform X2 n=1 Tax=Pungitius pungitius TaxID=134920 RepID=UPI002E0F58F0
MSPNKDVKLPPLTPSQKQRLTCDHGVQNDTLLTEEGQEGESAGAVSVQPAVTEFSSKGSSYIYSGPWRKPQLLMHLENYVNKELHAIGSHEPKFQELKLQVYRDVFGCFIKEFKTYQPLLAAIKKEYENTLVYQQNKIQELMPLRSHLRLVTEDCDRRIQARWAEEQAEIRALKREKQQLQRDIEARREKEKAMQAVVDRLQSELSNQYLQYREERDARQLLICQLNHLTRGSVKGDHPSDESTGAKDRVELQLALKVCRKDLTEVQEELIKMKADYWDVVPKRNWDTLEQTHKQNLLQMNRLQGDFDQLKSEYDTLLQLHKRGSIQMETHDPVAVQMEGSLFQRQIQSDLLKEPINSDDPESGNLTVQEFRMASRTVLPLKSDQGTDELVDSTRSDPDNSDETISTQRLHSLLAENGAVPPALGESEKNAASTSGPASD